MKVAEPSYTCQHFSLANAKGEGQDNLPELLRSVASAIERYEIKPMDLLDVTFVEEITAEGPWWSATVYWSPEAQDSSVAVVMLLEYLLGFWDNAVWR